MITKTETPEVARIKAACRCANPRCNCQRGGNVHCPSHNDPGPSLSVDEDGKGGVLVKCFAGCAQESVINELANLGVWPERKGDNPNLIPNRNQNRIEPMATYEYRNSAGDLVAVKGRFEPVGGRKYFRWRLPNMRGWEGLDGMPMSAVPLWGSELLTSAPLTQPIFYVEGEKAAQACRDKGLVSVTHGGGAETHDFGDSLLVLKGREVLLWPDNDEAGRKYMARVHSLLRPIARSVVLVDPPAPPKGDAVEFFDGGGTVGGLLKNAPPTRPTVDYLAHDAVRVRMPSSIGTVNFAYTNMEKSSRELSAELEIRLDGGGEPYSQRINMLSGSQVTELRRTLNDIYGKEMGWAQMLNTSIALARKAFLEQDRAIRLSDIPMQGPPEFLVDSLLPAGVPTIWFGTGSSCKTYLALRAAISVATGTDFMGMGVRRTGGVMLVDYEDSSINFRIRCDRITKGLGLDDYGDLPLLHWPAEGIPLVDQIEAIKTAVERHGITLLIVDSAASACGGEPEKADITLRYFMALQKLGAGITTLTIAHVSKGSDEMRPFGSIFWENQARRTVNFSRTDDEDTDDMDVGVYFRKVNQGKKPKPMAFHVNFDKDIGPVTFSLTEVRDVPMLNGRRPLKFQILDVLLQPMTAVDIAEAIGAKEESVGAILRNERTMFVRLEASGGGRGNQTRWAKLAKANE